MTDAMPREALEGARAYEHLHVAALFAEWAPRVLDAAGAKPGDDVLDVACGTGVLARAALDRVGAAGTVTGLDLDPAMLAVAQDITPQVAWRQGDATDLPFGDALFDRVTNQFGLMFVADRDAAIREMLRVVRDDGRVCVCVWDALDASPAYPIEVDLLARMAGHDAENALRAPFVLGDRAEVVRLFERAGVDSVEMTTIVGTARFPSTRAMVEADLRGWLPVMGVHLDEPTIEPILAAAEESLRPLTTADGALVFDSPARLVSGVRG